MNKSEIEITYEPNLVKISLRNIGIAVKQEAGKFVVFCPTLKVIGYSNKNTNAAFKDFEENLNLFFKVHVKKDTLRDALLSKNWKRIGSTPENNYDSELHPALQEKNYEIAVAA